MAIALHASRIRDAESAAQAANDAATAAKEQVEVAKAQIEVTRIGIFDLERAYVDAGPSEIITSFVADPKPATGFYRPGVDPLEITVKIAMKNTGRTRAVVTRAYGEFSRNMLGEEPIYNFRAGTNYVTDLSLSADEPAIFPHDFRSQYIGEQFFFGFIEYKDIFKKPGILDLHGSFPGFGKR